jgi:hypothetical protein
VLLVLRWDTRIGATAAGCAWDGWGSQRQGSELEQDQHVVIGGCPVHSQPTAAGAAVNEHPPAFAAHGDRYRFHDAGALGLPVAWDVAIKVPGPQAVRAVVSVRGAGSVERDV